MRNYTFYNYKGGKTLFPKNDWLTEAYLAEHEKIFMTEYLANDDRRKVYHRYRLRTCDPTRFTDTLEYDLKCPHCNGDLRLCGLPDNLSTATMLEALNLLYTREELERLLGELKEQAE